MHLYIHSRTIRSFEIRLPGIGIHHTHLGIDTGHHGIGSLSPLSHLSFPVPTPGVCFQWGHLIKTILDMGHLSRRQEGQLRAACPSDLVMWPEVMKWRWHSRGLYFLVTLPYNPIKQPVGNHWVKMAQVERKSSNWGLFQKSSSDSWFWFPCLGLVWQSYFLLTLNLNSQVVSLGHRHWCISAFHRDPTILAIKQW